MKKLLSLAFALMLMLTLSVAVFAADAESVAVYVTISDDKGDLVVTQEKITVTDIDGDGAFTVNDALYCAHEAKYEGGTEAGYASSMTAYGLSLDKLWGVANGGSYGYCVNNASAMSLADPISAGDYVQAYVYTDLVAWSDTFSCFDANTADIDEGEEVTLTLSASGYDENWAPVTLAVADAKITVNGETTEYTTDAEGKVTLSFDKAGTYVISAESDNMTLVPPVCIVTVNAVEDTTPESDSSADSESTPDAGDNTNIALFVIVAIVAFAGSAVAVKNR